MIWNSWGWCNLVLVHAMFSSENLCVQSTAPSGKTGSCLLYMQSDIVVVSVSNLYLPFSFTLSMFIFMLQTGHKNVSKLPRFCIDVFERKERHLFNEKIKSSAISSCILVLPFWSYQHFVLIGHVPPTQFSCSALQFKSRLKKRLQMILRFVQHLYYS